MLKTATSSIQVIDRVTALLEAITAHPEPSSLKYLSAETRLHPSTAFRILKGVDQPWARGTHARRPLRPRRETPAIRQPRAWQGGSVARGQAHHGMAVLAGGRNGESHRARKRRSGVRRTRHPEPHDARRAGDRQPCAVACHRRGQTCFSPRKEKRPAASTRAAPGCPATPPTPLPWPRSFGPRLQKRTSRLTRSTTRRRNRSCLHRRTGS